MNNIKISLVFACYNVASYLEELYKLLQNQTYQNIEVILVEDCSTDNTKAILNSFSDSRVKVVKNNQNQGAAISRNIGITYATGDYIGFPDPDDLFDLNLISEVVEVIKQYQPPVILCGMKEEYEVEGKVKYIKEILSLYSGYIKENIQSVLVDLEEKMLFGYTNNKFYQRELLLDNQLAHKKMALKEDFEFNIQAYNIIKTFYILNKPYYFYKKRQNGGSLTSKFVPEYFEIHLESVLLFKQLLEKQGELSHASKALLVNRFYRYLLSAIERNTNPQANLSFKQQQEWIKSILEKDTRCTWFIQNSSLLNRKLKPLEFLIKHKQYGILNISGYLISLIKKYLPIFFAKVK